MSKLAVHIKGQSIQLPNLKLPQKSTSDQNFQCTNGLRLYHFDQYVHYVTFHSQVRKLYGTDRQSQ